MTIFAHLYQLAGDKVMNEDNLLKLKGNLLKSLLGFEVLTVLSM
jgi:hypothetical protein